MNSADKQAVLHCLKSMIDEEVCEECPLYGTTGTDHKMSEIPTGAEGSDKE